jgi:peptidyl-tRNA hydrolase
MEEVAPVEDPIVMYLIVRESLGMSTGKACAQCGHAAGLIVFDYMDLKDESRKLHKLIVENTLGLSPESPALLAYKELYAEQSRRLSIVGEWRATGYRKVTLRASDKEWEKVKADYPRDVLVVDAGLTEIAAGSETVIGLWPMRKSQATKTIRKLQVLK